MKHPTSVPSARGNRPKNPGSRRGRRAPRDRQWQDNGGRTSPCPAKSAPYQIFVLKTDRLYGDLICRQIKALWDDARVEVFQSGDDALGAMEQTPPDLFISGIKIEDMDGLEHLERASERGLAILIVTSRRDTHTFNLLKRVRYDGIYDARAEGLRNLGTAVERAIAGEKYISPTFAPHLKPSKHPTLESLTEKEQIVLSVVGDGSDDQEAARRLGLSPHTINTHRKAIMAKCRLHHKGQLIRYALREGYVQVGPRGVFHPGFQRKIRDICKVATPPDGAMVQSKAAETIAPEKERLPENEDRALIQS